MRARLTATGNDGAEGYGNAAGFQADVELIAESLGANKGEHAGLFGVHRLLRRVRTFGFHLARLDVRQDARVHDDVLAVLLDDPEWAGRSADERAARLRGLAAGHETFTAHADPAAERLRAVFATLADARRHYGPEATGPY